MRRGGPREIPPPLELQCLRTLWKLGAANVRQVQQTLAPERNLAYTTVMTVMDRLARKGAVERRKVGRSFVYSPVLTRETLQRLAVRDLVDSLFGGSLEELLAYLSGRKEGSPANAPIVSLDTALL